VILDMVLPKLNGRQVYDLIHGLAPQTRFLFSSGYSPHAIDVEFIQQQGMPLIQKPYAPKVLLAAVGRVLDNPASPATNP
jgi:DNA-binding NtrC family response regulator